MSTNDVTLSGITAQDFVGPLKFDSVGDFVPNGTLVKAAADCTAIAIP